MANGNLRTNKSRSIEYINRKHQPTGNGKNTMEKPSQSDPLQNTTFDRLQQTPTNLFPFNKQMNSQLARDAYLMCE